MDEKNTTNEKAKSSSQATQHEDAALKTMMQFFAEELLPRLGIEGTVVYSAPTELVWLTLCPLMGGKMSQKDRIKSAYEITKEAVSVTRDELRKIEAVIYAMADKFLDPVDMKEIEEAVRMTKLGQMLVDTGKREGKIEGKAEGEALFTVLTKKLLKDSRTNDLLKATDDLAFRKSLYHEYGISED